MQLETRDHFGSGCVTRMSLREIGCCGAYCRTCKAYANKKCKGCKIGYGPGGRDLEKARCPMKVCCLKKGLNTCADCALLDTCVTINRFFGKKGYKYQKYKQAILFVKAEGYEKFLKIAAKWTNAYGKY